MKVYVRKQFGYYDMFATYPYPGVNCLASVYCSKFWRSVFNNLLAREGVKQFNLTAKEVV